MKKFFKDHLITIASIIFLMIAFKYLINFIDMRIDYLLDDDMSSELLLSNLVTNEGNFIFSRNWYYSTEIRILYLQIIFGFLFRLYENWHYVRYLGTVICYILMVGSYYALYRILKVKKLSVLASTLCLLPVSSVYFYVVLTGMSYIPHIVLCNLILCLIFGSNFLNKRIRLILIFLLSLLSGMAGYRYFLILFLPIFGSSFLLFIYRKIKSTYYSGSLFYNSCCSLFGGVIGYLINSLYLSKIFYFGFYSEIKFGISSFERVANVLTSYLRVLGYNTTFGGKFSLISLFLSLLILALIVYSSLIVLISKNYTEEQKVYSLFGILNVLLLIAVNVISTMHFEDRYTVLCITYILPSAFIYLENYQNKTIKYSISLMMVISFVFMSRYIYSYNFNNNTNSSLKEMTDYIVSQGYTSAYSTVAYGNMITELSNGEVRVYKFETSYDEQAKDFEDHNVWLQRIDNDTDKPKGKVCLFLKYYNPGMDDYIIYWENDDAVIYGFDSYNEMKKVIYNR